MTPAWPFKILVKYATRGRVGRFIDGLNTIYDLCEMPEYIRVMVTADIDDPSMFNEHIKETVKSYPNCHIMYGISKNKIHAINRDMDILPERFKDWDIVANFSDDQRWTAPRWDTHIRVDFNSVFPNMDGYMAYRDPDTNGALSTLYIAGRRFFDRFGFIYDPIFVSLFADNLVEDCAKALGKYHYTGYDIYRHYNPSYNYPNFLPDQMYLEQQKIGWDVDQKTYYQIIQNGLDKYLEKYDTNI